MTSFERSIQQVGSSAETPCGAALDGTCSTSPCMEGVGSAFVQQRGAALPCCPSPETGRSAGTSPRDVSH
eukprot:3954817-Amphidinium_carterae.1